jgi:hypothetical protein
MVVNNWFPKLPAIMTPEGTKRNWSDTVLKFVAVAV